MFATNPFVALWKLKKGLPAFFSCMVKVASNFKALPLHTIYLHTYARKSIVIAHTIHLVMKNVCYISHTNLHFRIHWGHPMRKVIRLSYSSGYAFFPLWKDDVKKNPRCRHPTFFEERSEHVRGTKNAARLLSNLPRASLPDSLHTRMYTDGCLAAWPTISRV